MEKLKLDDNLDQKVEDLWFTGQDLVYAKNYEDAKELMEKTWDMLPTPKENYSPS